MISPAEYASYHGWPPQADSEDDYTFKLRIANALRARGDIIESAEVMAGRRYDDPENPPVGDLGNPLTGAAGYLAQQLQNVHYRGADDDPIAGAVALAPPDPSRAFIAAAFDLLGPGVAMDLLDQDRGER